MSKLVLHPITERQMVQLASRPPHALVVSGAAGSGKQALATELLATIMRLTTETVADHPYIRVINPEINQAISIDAIRSLEKFMSLKVPAHSEVSRAVIIVNAHTLTHEAQNALLKLLEEPPKHTMLILTSANNTALLPTVLSRLQTLSVKRPSTEQLQRHFSEQGNAAPVITQALAMSGGLPGLADALLHDDESHPLVIATAKAREILQKSTYERLLLVDSLAKDRQAAIDVLFMIEQMAHSALNKASQAGIQRWHSILATTFSARRTLMASGQTKLALTNLMLNL